MRAPERLRVAGSNGLLIIALGGTVLAVLITGMAGYAFAKLRFRGRDRLFRVLLAGMVIPGQVAMLPMFIMLREMGLINTLFGAMIPVLAPIYGIFLVRQYALSIPDDLLDAARLDGASELDRKSGRVGKECRSGWSADHSG